MTIAKLALLVFSGLVVVSCYDPNAPSAEDYKALQDKQEETNSKLIEEHEKHRQTEAEKNNLAKQLGELQQRFDNLDNALKAITDELKKTKDDLEKNKQEFNDYRNKYRVSIRKKIPGETYEQLETTDHTAYQHVKITKVDAAYVYFTHDAGASKVAVLDLSAEWADRLDYDADEGKSYMEELARNKAQADELKLQTDIINNKKANLEAQQSSTEVAEYKNAKLKDVLESKRNTLYAMLKNFQRNLANRQALYRTGNWINRTQPEDSNILLESSQDMAFLEAKKIAGEINELKSRIN